MITRAMGQVAILVYRQQCCALSCCASNLLTPFNHTTCTLLGMLVTSESVQFAALFDACDALYIRRANISQTMP